MRVFGVGCFGVKGTESATGVAEHGMCGCQLFLKYERVGSKNGFSDSETPRVRDGVAPKWPFRDCRSSNVREGVSNMACWEHVSANDCRSVWPCPHDCGDHSCQVPIFGVDPP